MTCENLGIIGPRFPSSRMGIAPISESLVQNIRKVSFPLETAKGHKPVVDDHHELSVDVICQIASGKATHGLAADLGKFPAVGEFIGQNFPILFDGLGAGIEHAMFRVISKESGVADTRELADESQLTTRVVQSKDIHGDV